MCDRRPVRQWSREDGFLLSSDPSRLRFDRVHGWLSRSYWSPGIDRERVEWAARNSLAYGLYDPAGGQVGYARVVTDRATFALLADVFVDESIRGRGLGRWMVGEITADPDLLDLRRWLLFTRDAHLLYARFGFQALDRPEFAMVRPGRADPRPPTAASPPNG